MYESKCDGSGFDSHSGDNNRNKDKSQSSTIQHVFVTLGRKVSKRVLFTGFFLPNPLVAQRSLTQL